MWFCIRFSKKKVEGIDRKESFIVVFEYNNTDNECFFCEKEFCLYNFGRVCITEFKTKKKCFCLIIIINKEEK